MVRLTAAEHCCQYSYRSTPHHFQGEILPHCGFIMGMVVRRAITDPKYVGEIDWADSQIEVVETAEHALVSKTASIVEELALKKVGTDHVETINDKIRRQQVEIERTGADGKVIPGQRST
jgi:hypothetical protein